MVASACSAVVTVPEPSRRVAPYSFLSSFRTSSAPGTVMVTSTTVTPPAIMALTTACACAALRARRTGIRPTRSMICAVVSDILFLFRRRGLSGDSCGAAFDDAFNFSQRGHAGVAGGGHGKRAVGHTAADGPVDGLAGPARERALVGGFHEFFQRQNPGAAPPRVHRTALRAHS